MRYFNGAFVCTFIPIGWYWSQEGGYSIFLAPSLIKGLWNQAPGVQRDKHKFTSWKGLDLCLSCPSHLPWQQCIDGDSRSPSFHLTRPHYKAWWISLDQMQPHGEVHFPHGACILKNKRKWLNLLEERLCEGWDLITPEPNASPGIEHRLNKYFWHEWKYKSTFRKKKLF